MNLNYDHIRLSSLPLSHFSHLPPDCLHIHPLLYQIMTVVALEVLYPTHFSLVYGGDDDDHEGGVSIAEDKPNEPCGSLSSGHRTHHPTEDKASHGGHKASGGHHDSSHGHNADGLDHSLHTPLEV